MNSIGSLRYTDEKSYKWKMPPQVLSQAISLEDLDNICYSCESVKNDEIRKLKAANRKLNNLVQFLSKEIKALELKTALSEKAIPLKKIVKEFTSTPEGKAAWQKAWDDRAEEWKKLAAAGKISRIKYYRLINGMDQATLANKLKTAQPNICRIEKLGYNVPIATLEKLAKIFKVKKGVLLGD